MDTANRTLNALDVDNAVVVEGKLAEGYRKQAPYDVIVFQGSVAEVPEAVKRQLADGGRLVAEVLDDAGIGRRTLVQRAGDSFSPRAFFDASPPLLQGSHRAAASAF